MLLISYSPSPIFPQTMLTLSKKTDYALISLAYLAGREGLLASARQIASAADLPLPLLMQILKTLHQHGILHSTRGVKGGYCLAPGAEAVSLLALIRIVDGEPEASPELSGTSNPAPLRLRSGHAAACGFANQGPLVAMHQKLLQFLEQVKVLDVIRPGRRIDVPVEAVRLCSPRAMRLIDQIKGPVRLGSSTQLGAGQPVVSTEELLTTTGSAGLI